MTGTERKVFQKYYPPDFDPRKIPKAKQPKNRQFIQRVMSPCNMSCNKCGEYVYKGKKFNMRRETAEGEYYLGLRIFRFYFRCPNCLNEITFKTDLENCDYALEHGATRLFEAHKHMVEQQKADDEKKEAEKADPMKNLELRTKMSRAELDALGELEELRETNRQKAGVNYEQLLEDYRAAEASSRDQQEMDDEQLVKSLFDRDSSGNIIRRLKDDSSSDSDDGDAGKPSGSGSKPGSSGGTAAASAADDAMFKAPQSYVLTKNKPSADQIRLDFGGGGPPSTSAVGAAPAAGAKRPSNPLLAKLVVVKSKKPKKTDDSAADGSLTELQKPSDDYYRPAQKDDKKPEGVGGLGLLGDYGSGSSSGGDSD